MKHYKIVVVGSGISSYFFLLGLDRKLYKKTCVLVGNTYSEKIYKQTRYTNFFLTNKFGGFASNWLGGFSEFHKKELKLMKNSFCLRLIKTHKLFNKFYNSIYVDYLNLKRPYFNNIKSSKKLSIGENKTIIENTNVLRVKKLQNIKYINSSLKNIKKRKSKIILTLDNKKNFISCDKLILAAGTISTAGIISKMLKLKKVYFKHQLYYQGFVFFPFKSFTFQKFKFSTRSYFDKKGKFRGTLEFNSNFIQKKLFKSSIFKNNKLLFFLSNTILNKFIFFNAFVNSRYCDALILNKKKSFEIKSLIKNETIEKFFILIKEYLQELFCFNFKNLKLLMLFKRKVGFDKHYYGIFFNKKNKKLKLNRKSEIEDHKNIFICDQSAINVDTPKFLTYLSIANSFSVGKIISKNNRNKLIHA